MSTQIREVLRCEKCGCVQFITHNLLCRKCYAPLYPPEPEVVPISQDGSLKTPPKPKIEREKPNSPHFGPILRILRLKLGLSQQSISYITGVPRAYISRVEGGYTHPGPVILKSICFALHTTIPGILALVRPTNEHPPDIDLICSLVSGLTSAQVEEIISVVKSKLEPPTL